jgi:hypothetical protein
MTEKRQTSQVYIICILPHFATKLWNITNFVTLFQAVMKFLPRPACLDQNLVLITYYILYRELLKTHAIYLVILTVYSGRRRFQANYCRLVFHLAICDTLLLLTGNLMFTVGPWMENQDRSNTRLRTVYNAS